MSQVRIPKTRLTLPLTPVWSIADRVYMKADNGPWIYQSSKDEVFMFKVTATEN